VYDELKYAVRQSDNYVQLVLTGYTKSLGTKNESSMIKPKIGLALIISSICVWVIDRSTRVMSDLFGELFCGAAYLQPVNGVVGDGSCGFNTDMYLAACLFFILLLVGSALLVGPKIIGIKRP
jgi:hypothetical protein